MKCANDIKRQSPNWLRWEKWASSRDNLLRGADFDASWKAGLHDVKRLSLLLDLPKRDPVPYQSKSFICNE